MYKRIYIYVYERGWGYDNYDDYYFYYCTVEFFRKARNLMKDPHGWERTAVVCGGSSQEDLNILNKMIFIHNVT